MGKTPAYLKDQTTNNELQYKTQQHFYQTNTSNFKSYSISGASGPMKSQGYRTFYNKTLSKLNNNNDNNDHDNYTSKNPQGQQRLAVSAMPGSRNHQQQGRKHNNFNNSREISHTSFISPSKLYYFRSTKMGGQ